MPIWLKKAEYYKTLPRIKMGKKIWTFGDIEIEKHKFYRNKTLIFLKNVDIEKVLISKKISFDENYEYFIGYLYNDHNVKPLHTYNAS